MTPNLPIRKPTRIEGFDYSTPGAFFVTVCAQGRGKIFGDVIDGEMRLNEYGEIAKACWEDLPNHYNNMELDVFIIMPDHFHGIISILPDFAQRSGLRPDPTDVNADNSTNVFGARSGLRPDPTDVNADNSTNVFNVRSGLRPDPTETIADKTPVGEGLRPSRRGTQDKRHGLSEFIRAFKSFSARRINETRNTPGAKIWQRSFYDHIIRNDEDLRTLRDYILNNPLELTIVEGSTQ